MLYYYFLRVGFTYIFDLVEFKVELNALSLVVETSFYFNKAGALNEVPGRLCFIAILTILGFC